MRETKGMCRDKPCAGLWFWREKALIHAVIVVGALTWMDVTDESACLGVGIGGKIILMEYAGTLSGNLATLVAGAQIDDPAATVSVVGKTLVLSAPRKGGTVLKLF